MSKENIVAYQICLPRNACLGGARLPCGRIWVFHVNDPLDLEPWKRRT